VESAAIFLSLIVNGLALRRSMGDELPDLDVIADLANTGVGRR
jgi:hypothetical protein